MNLSTASIAELNQHLRTFHQAPDPEGENLSDRIARKQDAISRATLDVTNKRAAHRKAVEEFEQSGSDAAESRIFKLETEIEKADRSIALNLNALDNLRKELRRHQADSDARLEQLLKPIFAELVRRQNDALAMAGEVDAALVLAHQVACQRLRGNSSVLQRGFALNLRERIAIWRERVTTILQPVA